MALPQLNLSHECSERLRSIRRSLSADAMRALVQAFVHSRLDYGNSLLTGVADVHFKHLQSVQNAAAQLVSGALAMTTSPHHKLLTTLHQFPVRSELCSRLWCWCGSVLTVLLLSRRTHDELTTRSQSPNHDRPAELRCRGSVSVEQSSGCSLETGDDSAIFQATTQGLSVRHNDVLMNRRNIQHRPALLWRFS